MFSTLCFSWKSPFFQSTRLIEKIKYCCPVSSFQPGVFDCEGKRSDPIGHRLIKILSSYFDSLI